MYQVVSILSAPRSGSSALARLVSVLGLSFGPKEDLLQDTSFNPYGFFERKDLIDTNEILIRESISDVSGEWLLSSGVHPNDIDWLLSGIHWASRAQPIDKNTRLSPAVHQRLKNSIAWMSSEEMPVWKDARLCLTLPVWGQLISTIPIVLWREPSQVASSIERMMGIPYILGEWLWAAYTSAAVKVATPNGKYLLIGYNELCRKPEQTVIVIANYLKNNKLDILPENIKKAAATIDVSVITQHGGDGPKDPDLKPIYEWVRSGAVGLAPDLPPRPVGPSDTALIATVRRLARRKTMYEEDLSKTRRFLRLLLSKKIIRILARLYGISRNPFVKADR